MVLHIFTLTSHEIIQYNIISSRSWYCTTVTCINVQFVRKSQLNPATSQLYMSNNAKQKCLSKVQLKVTNPKNNMECNVSFSAVNSDLQCISDAETCTKMGLIMKRKSKLLSRVQEQHQRSWRNSTNGGSKDTSPSFTMSPIAIEKVVRDEINALVEREILYPVDEPTKWVSQMVPASPGLQGSPMER